MSEAERNYRCAELVADTIRQLKSLNSLLGADSPYAEHREMCIRVLTTLEANVRRLTEGREDE